jgi:hypothetical protein
MPLKQVITIILLAVILGTGAEYFFIIRNGGDPFADIARLMGGSVGLCPYRCPCASSGRFHIQPLFP